MLIGKLSDYVEMVSGQIMTRIAVRNENEECVGTYKVVIPKAITSDALLNLAEMPEERVKVKPDERRITALGDIVMKLSTPFDAAMVSENAVGCIVPSFCTIIKPKNIDAQYLLAFLSSKICKGQLRDKVEGAVMTILTLGKIGDLDIPIPDRNTQMKIGRQFDDVQYKKQLMQRIIELEEKKNDVTIRELFK